jgi:hypothetical protein
MHPLISVIHVGDIQITDEEDAANKVYKQVDGQ